MPAGVKRRKKFLPGSGGVFFLITEKVVTGTTYEDAETPARYAPDNHEDVRSSAMG
jgi:hypothetical protein